MNSLGKYFLAPLVLTFVFIGLFESINPPSWPKEAIGYELFACWIVMAAILGRRMTKDEEELKQEAKRREEEAAKMEMEMYLVNMRSQAEVELEKHRLTLEAQAPRQGENNQPKDATSRN